VISGTPSAQPAGQHTIVVRAANGIGSDATRTVIVTIRKALAVSTNSLPGARFQTSYGARIAATGGQPDYRFSIGSGALPRGLAMSSSGRIAGVPKATVGSYRFGISATDASNPARTVRKQFTIVIGRGTTKLTITRPARPRSKRVDAVLVGGSPSQFLAGRTVVFKAGSRVLCRDSTDSRGHARCRPVTTKWKPSNLSASYGGSAAWRPSSD
jgi:hypothetical protein